MIESLAGGPIFRFGRGASSKAALEAAGLAALDGLGRGAGGASGATQAATVMINVRQAKRFIVIDHIRDGQTVFGERFTGQESGVIPRRRGAESTAGV